MRFLCLCDREVDLLEFFGLFFVGIRLLFDLLEKMVGCVGIFVGMGFCMIVGRRSLGGKDVFKIGDSAELEIDGCVDKRRGVDVGLGFWRSVFLVDIFSLEVESFDIAGRLVGLLEGGIGDLVLVGGGVLFCVEILIGGGVLSFVGL